MAEVPIPGIQVTVRRGGTTRTLLGQAADSDASEIRYGSRMNGGHKECSFHIYESEWAAFPGVYRDSAIVEVEIASGFPDAGQRLYTGFVRGVLPTGDGLAEVQAVGFSEMLLERQDPKLWRSDNYDDWVSLDDDPFSDSFQNKQSDTIRIEASKGALVVTVPKSGAVGSNETARIGWWAEALLDGVGYFVHRVRRVKGRIEKKTNTKAWGLSLQKYPDGPSSGITGGNAFDGSGGQGNLDGAISQQGAFLFDMTSPSATPPPMITFEFRRKGAANSSLKNAFKCHIVNLKVWGDATRDGSAPDTRVASQMVRDLAAVVGFNHSSSLVVATTADMLPWWHQSGSWGEPLDQWAGLHGYRWGVWDFVTGAPQVEFRPWNDGTVWTVRGYSATANAEVELNKSGEAYSLIDVTWRRSGTHRIRHVYESVSPNPFAGAPAPLNNRQRTLHYHIEEPQPSDALPKAVAALLAAEWSSSKPSGKIRLFWATTGGVDRTALPIRAGDRITITDYPTGSLTLRIYEADWDETDGAMVLQVGPAPSGLEALMFHFASRTKNEGKHQIYA